MATQLIGLASTPEQGLGFGVRVFGYMNHNLNSVKGVFRGLYVGLL